MTQLKLALIAFFLALVHSSQSMSILKRQMSSEALCGPQIPCGWGVYDPSSQPLHVSFNQPERQVDYFVQNLCKCDKQRGERCFRSQDDVSISAYVYRCVRPRSQRNIINSSSSDA